MKIEFSRKYFRAKSELSYSLHLNLEFKHVKFEKNVFKRNNNFQISGSAISNVKTMQLPIREFEQISSASEKS